MRFISMTRDCKTPDFTKSCTKGWINENVNEHYRFMFPNATYLPGICTISGNETRDTLFTGGGPLHVGIEGAYCAIWS
jgi:hypothetical protein